MDGNYTAFYDNVSRPSHYAEGRKYEPKDVIRDWGLNFNLGSAVKYISRAGRKGPILEDLRKARQFIDFEISAIEAQKAEENDGKENADALNKDLTVKYISRAGRKGPIRDVFKTMSDAKVSAMGAACQIVLKKRKSFNEVASWGISPLASMVSTLKTSLPKEQYDILKALSPEERNVMFFLLDETLKTDL
jgi:hypothetical protein